MVIRQVIENTIIFFISFFLVNNINLSCKISADIGIYGLGNVVDDKTLYLAVAKEIGANLIREPERTPTDLRLLKAIAYPSGEPAFYLFSGTLAQ